MSRKRPPLRAERRMGELTAAMPKRVTVENTVTREYAKEAEHHARRREIWNALHGERRGKKSQNEISKDYATGAGATGPKQ